MKKLFFIVVEIYAYDTISAAFRLLKYYYLDSILLIIKRKSGMETVMKENQNLKTFTMDKLENIHIYGRTGSQRMPLPLFWTASGVELYVTGTELWMEVEADYETHEPWISIEINGAWIGRQMITAGKKDICIFRNMDAAATKRVRIFRDVQAMSDDASLFLQIHSFQSDGIFKEVPEKSRKIEIIGDSITSGEGTIGAQEEQDWISMWFTALNNYAVITADRLDADFHIVSQSGWGIVTGWDNNPHSSLPDYYEQVCGLCKGERNEKAGAKENYDFSSWQPDSVIINLGTNDAGAFENEEWTDPQTGLTFKQHKNEDGTYNKEDERRLIEKAKAFLKTIRKHNPNAEILWAYGMIGTPILSMLETAIQEFVKETGDAKARLIVLPQAEGDGIGARCHPGVINHRQAADILVKELEK